MLQTQNTAPEFPFRMPAEWEPHEGTWLAWPHNKEHWPGKFPRIPPVYAQIIRGLAKSEKVFVCVNDKNMEDGARKILVQAGVTVGESANIIFYRIPTDASWSRDHGPVFVRDREGKQIILDWIFNCWGEKYPPWDKDDAVPKHIAEIFGFPCVRPGIVLEGGSIDVNGKSSLLTTEQCLLNKNRNPHLNRNEIEEYLKKYLGAANILWLKEGIVGDDTDGHIDDIARFADEKTILCAVEENPQDENYEILKQNREDLKKMRDQDGEFFKIINIPMPEPVIDDLENMRLPASYINFYIANKIVLVPTFRSKRDAKVLKIFEELFKSREIVGIDCTDFVLGLGTIHCSTQQQPAILD